MRWLLTLAFLLPLAAAQPATVGPVEQPHVTMDAQGLWIHFAVPGAPLAAVESPVVRFSVNDGPLQEAAAAFVGQVVASERLQDIARTSVYAAHVEAAPGDVVRYTAGTMSRGFTAEHAVAMPPSGTLRFVALGDIGYDGVAQDGSDDGSFPGGAPPIVVRDLSIAQGPDLVIIPGDLAYENSLIGWDRFMRMYTPLQATIPTMPSIGNHEWMENSEAIGYGQFLAEYVLPGDEHDFLFRAGPVTFVAINSDNICAGDTYRTSYGHQAEPCPFGEPDEAKIARIDALLAEAAADENPWTVAYMHHPPFSWGRHNSDFGVRHLLSPLFEQHDVDLVVTAHDHLYSRTYPVLGDERVTQHGDDYVAGDGIVYIVVGGGGRALYAVRDPEAPPPAWHAAGGEFHHTMVADADNATLRVEVIASNGTVMDAFTIRKAEAAAAPDAEAAGYGLWVAFLGVVVSQRASNRFRRGP